MAMLDVGEFLARLTARAPPPDADHIDSSGTRNGAIVLAAGLRGVPRGPAAFMLAKYCDDPGSLATAKRELARVLLPVSCRWRGFRPEDPADYARLLAMCDTAITLDIHPPACRSCNRRGILWKKAAQVLCPECGGTGTRPATKAHVAREIGVRRDRYQRTWRRRYETVERHVSDWELAARSRLVANLHGPRKL